MKKFLEQLLGFVARRIIARYRPIIVAITGSVGKTSTKEAIATVLRRRYRLRASPKNYNNELGVPLTIIGARAGGRSALAWAGVIARGIFELVTRDPRYPEVLVLEMGIDRPGDLAKLVAIAPPNISVVTAVSPAHTEFFKDLKAVQKEKGTVVRALERDGVAVLNRDNDLAYELRELVRATVKTFGFRDGADFRAIEHRLSVNPLGTTFKLMWQGNAVPLHLPGVLGTPAVHAALAAAAVGTALGLNLHEVSDALLEYEPPPGRLRLIPGIKGTTLIDDTYNSSPLAALAALEALRDLSALLPGRLVAVLGDMKELGQYARESHEEVGARAKKIGIDFLVTVGELAKEYGGHASAPDAVAAGRLVQDYIREGDIILIKGSQSMRMERAVKELMAEPEKAGALLVRQEPEWQ